MYRDTFSSTYDHTNTAGPLSVQASPYAQMAHHPIIDRLFGSSPAFIYVMNVKSHRIIYASPNMHQLLGYNHEDFTGTDYEELQKLYAKEDSDKVINADLKFMELLFAPGQSAQLKSVLTCRIMRKNGSMVAVQQQKVVLETDSFGKPSLVMGMIMDITCGGKKNPDFCSAIMVHHPSEGWTEITSAGECGNALSNREKEILLLLSEGKSSKIIASELDISVNTVNNHRKNMLMKTKTNNIAGLMSYCLSQGII